MSAKGKEIYSNLRWTPTNRMSAKMKYFSINFLHFILNACHILSTFTNQWHCLDLHSRCRHLAHSHTHTPNITIIPLRIIISLIQCSEYTALIKTLQSLLMRCAAMPLWSTFTKKYIYISWFLNLLEPVKKIQNFLHRWC